MDIIFKNKRYKEQIDQLSDETVTLIAKDHAYCLKKTYAAYLNQSRIYEISLNRVERRSSSEPSDSYW